MAKVFEDEFTDIQSGMVSLVIEALETANMTVDKIYIYAFGTAHEGFFNLFFVKDGKLLHNNQVGISYVPTSSIQTFRCAMYSAESYCYPADKPPAGRFHGP